MTGSGEAAGRSTGPSQCVRHWLHPQDLWVMPWGAPRLCSELPQLTQSPAVSQPDRSVLNLEVLRAGVASDRFPAWTVLHGPEHPHSHGNSLPRAVRLLPMKTEIAAKVE